MKLNDLKSLNDRAAQILAADDWTIERLSTATVKQVSAYSGIGRVTARRAIDEAAQALNEQGVEVSAQLANKQYYQKSPPRKIVSDWHKDGMSLLDIALASSSALAKIKGIEEALALTLISAAQDMLNKEKLYESQNVYIGGGAATVPAASAAFPAEWLSGAVAPPLMGARIRRNFDRAQEAYKAANG